MNRKLAALLAVGLGVSASGLRAQDAQEVGRFQVTPVIGVMRFDRTSALSTPATAFSTHMWPYAGLTALYRIRGGVRVGLYLEGTRAETSPYYYPLVMLRTGNTYELDSLTQRVVVMSYGLAATVDLPFGAKLLPYLRGGVGQHSVFPDVQHMRSTASITGAEFSLGGGLGYKTGGGGLVRLELVDNMWSKWDRDRLNPTALAYQNTLFPEDNPPGITWAKPSIIHNLRFMLGFTFTPSASGTH